MAILVPVIGVSKCVNEKNKVMLTYNEFFRYFGYIKQTPQTPPYSTSQTNRLLILKFIYRSFKTKFIQLMAKQKKEN